MRNVLYYIVVVAIIAISLAFLRSHRKFGSAVVDKTIFVEIMTDRDRLIALIEKCRGKSSIHRVESAMPLNLLIIL